MSVKRVDIDVAAAQVVAAIERAEEAEALLRNSLPIMREAVDDAIAYANKCAERYGKLSPQTRRARHVADDWNATLGSAEVFLQERTDG